MRRLIVGFLICCVSAFAVIEPCRAERIPDLDVAVKQSLRSLIGDLDVKGTNQAAKTDSLAVALRSLGEVTAIQLSDPVEAQGLVNFNCHVIHDRGSSDWSLHTTDGGRIVSYEFSVLPGAEERGKPDPPAVDPRVVEFLYATTRAKKDKQAENVSYSGERGPLSFGAASVRIPDDHKIGRIELPSSWSVFGLDLVTAPNEHKHFVIKNVVPLSEDEFGRIVRAKGAKTALVFVHGFNTTFEDALYRNAQIVWDLQFSGLSVLFTWASRGEVTDYVYDKDSAYLARNSFIALLDKLKRDYGIEQVNVVAHSMGNLVALDALANDSQTVNPVKIARLVMAAPDVDRDQFRLLAPEAQAIVGGMTLYASSADRAMELSRRLAGGVPRAGDVPPDGPIVLPNLETIDVSAVGDDIFGLNHNVFAGSRDVLEDISALLRFNEPPPRLIQIRAVPAPPATPRYWRYVP